MCVQEDTCVRCPWESSNRVRRTAKEGKATRAHIIVSLHSNTEDDNVNIGCEDRGEENIPWTDLGSVFTLSAKLPYLFSKRHDTGPFRKCNLQSDIHIHTENNQAPVCKYYEIHYGSLLLGLRKAASTMDMDTKEERETKEGYPKLIRLRKTKQTLDRFISL